MKKTRRIGAVVAAAVVAASAIIAWQAWASTVRGTWGRVDFTRPLAVPPLAESRLDGDRRVFDLRLQAGRTDFGPDLGTVETWGINGTYLGPTLRATRGERVQVNVTNDLDETTTLHWHGMELPGEADGGPHQLIAPGATWSPSWQVDQPAATLWYHPHLHGSTAQHVYRGLSGLFLVDDPTVPDALPQQYGVDDLPVVLQDKNFAGGRLVWGDSVLSSVGLLGDTMLVNGTVGPYFEVTTEAVRLRLLNGSNARTYHLGFADDRRFDLIATDGGLLDRPRPLDRLRLSPGERAEIVVRLEPGERTVLRSHPASLGAGWLSDRLAGAEDRLDLLELRATDRLAPSPELPQRLAELPDVTDAAEADVDRSFALAGDRINGLEMDMGRIDAVAPLGGEEIWEVTNTDGSPHNFHVHGVQFQVVATTVGDTPLRDGSPPPLSGTIPDELAGWQDTVFVPPGHTHRLLLRFHHEADANAPYMLHCHLLRHEDAGMMTQFVVLPPGHTPAPLSPEHPNGHHG